MAVKINFATFHILKNLIIIPVIRCLLMVCISIQLFIAFWGFYNILHVTSWSSVYDVTKNISNGFTKTIESLISIYLMTSIIVKAKTFLGDPVKSDFSFFKNIGFRSIWMGIGTFYIINSNIQDDEAMKILTEQVQFMATNVQFLKDQVKFVHWARYITFATGLLFIIFSFLIQFGQKLLFCGNWSRNVEEDDYETISTPKKWWHLKITLKILLFVYYFVIISFPVFVIGIHIVFLYSDFKEYTVPTNTTSNQKVIAIVDVVVGNKVMYGAPDLILAFIILPQLIKQFWWKPFRQIPSITILLYVYLLFNIHLQAMKYSIWIFQEEQWFHMSDNLFRKCSLGLLIGYISFPISFWALFIFVKFDNDDADVVNGLNLCKYLSMRLWIPLTTVFNKYIFKPIKWYTLIYTLAVLFGLSGGVATTLSQNYQKFYIDFKELPMLTEIKNDFQTIHDKITTVSNGFIIVAANLNPCLNFDKKSGSSSINDLIAKQVTSKGADGLIGQTPSTSKTTLQQLYDASNNDDFRNKCFKKQNEKLKWSGSTIKLCRNVQYIDDTFSMSKITVKQGKNHGTPPNCSTAAKCLKDSNTVVKSEYELEVDDTCENVACAVLIGGLTAAFAVSFTPFAGPAISKGIQLALRIGQGVRRFGTVFKRVATQVKAKKKKIQKLYKIFSKLLGVKSLTVENNYQFYYFLAPALLLAIVAFGLGFFRRRNSSNVGKTVFVSFFVLLAGVCGTLTYLSFVFTELLKTLLDPFKSISPVTINTAVGMDMIKWGYALSTLSSLLFVLAALHLTFNQTNEALSKENKPSHSQKVIQNRQNKRHKEAAKIQIFILPEKHYANKFSGWLVALILTIPVYYIIFTANANQYEILDVQLTPSAALEELRVTFGQIGALEREFGSVEDLNSQSNENLCDIVGIAVKTIIDNLKLPIPNVFKIGDLFDLTRDIRKTVAGVITKVRKTVKLHINGFNLFEGTKFAILKLGFAFWQTILVFGIPIFIIVGTAICFLFSLIQHIGFLRNNKTINQIIMPFFEQMIIPASIGSFSNQLSIIGIFSIMDGFDTPMFSFSMQVGKMVTYGLIATVICMIASVFRIMTEYAPIDDNLTDDDDKNTGLITTNL